MATEESSRWYPGKFASKALGRRGSVQTESSSSSGPAPTATTASPSTGTRSKTDSLRRRSSMSSVPITTNVVPTVVAKSPTKMPSYPRVPIGNCHLQIFGLKYPTATYPSIRVELDGDVRDYADLNEFFEENFTIFDISSQVVISLIENYSISVPEVIGQIVLHFSTYLSGSGPLPSIREHRMFFPYRGGPKTWDTIGVFQSGFETMAGTAMTKPRQALGFIDMRMELSLIPGKVPSFFLRPPGAVDYHREASILAVDDVYLEHCFQRDWKRFLRSIQIPSFLANFVKLPEIVIPLVLFAFVCFACKSYVLPLVVLVVVGLNGMLTKFSRNFNHVIVWNDGFAPPPYITPPTTRASTRIITESDNNSDPPQSSNSIATAIAVPVDTQTSISRPSGKDSIQSTNIPNEFIPLRKIARDYHILLFDLANILEKISNLTSFAEPAMSMMFYQYYLVASFAACFVIGLLSFGGLVFIVFSIAIVAYIFKDQLQAELAAIVSPLPDAKLESARTFSRPQQVIRALYFFWDRIPTDLELTHRYIASLSYVKDDGAELLDAAEAHK